MSNAPGTGLLNGPPGAFYFVRKALSFGIRAEKLPVLLPLSGEGTLPGFCG